MRLIPKREMLKRVGVSYPTIWRWMRDGSFPRSRAVGDRSMWIESEVDAWLADLPVRKLKGDAPANAGLIPSA
jgi:predicted DNA-binding transcriptional regulator AlpA